MLYVSTVVHIVIMSPAIVLQLLQYALVESITSKAAMCMIFSLLLPVITVSEH